MHGSRMMNTIRATFLTLATAGLLFAASTANAACGDPAGFKPGTISKLPLLVQPNGGHQQPGSNSIVGLWHVTYKSGGELFYDALDQWHGDGTELENANVPPIYGNVCMGVWTQSADGTIQLSHIGWSFNADGSSAGYFTLGEANRVGSTGNTYSGEFEYRAYDVDGNFLGALRGTLSAQRISVK